MSTPSLIAFIPARGGSKGIHRKNLIPLASRPLITHTIEAAHHAQVFSRVIVSTDDAEIEALATSLECTIHKRPPHLSTDSSRVVDAVLDAAAQLQLDDDAIIFVLQPTSPLRRSNHITSALAVQRESSLGSVVSVVECEHHPLKAVAITDGVVSAAFEQKFLESSRQDLPRMFRPNGAIYAMPLSLIRKTNSLVPAGASAFEMTPDDSIDIDTIADIERAETALRHQA